VKRWLDTLTARPAVARGFKVAEEVRNPPGSMQDPKVREVLFNQRARA
jgi:GSH-dependent disulfide-bond oxidoreductase